MNFIRKLPTPKEIKELYPLSDELRKIKENNDIEIQKIFKNESNKLLLIIGPCSADNEDSVIDYISRLRKIQEIIKDEIVIIPRLYTNKPRTKGVGYKGMLHQPDPLKEEDMLKGLIAIRKLHMRALKETGFSCADEMLYSENHRYLSDILSYVAVGARSSEDQQHRLTASGLSVPVGMKNPTSGDTTVMLNAISAAQHPHTFIYRGWEVKSEGNPLTHAILRGYTNKEGDSTPNYYYEDLINLINIYTEENYKFPSIIIDTNHSNSNKNYEEQINIAKYVINLTNSNKNLKNIIKGLMIESYIEDGCQPIDGGVYGKSITDPCLGWEKTERLILDLYKLRKENK
jgi:3-deoxy-7-phosphoheptulonate synthase